MLSLVSGPTTPPLESWTLGRLIAKQAKDHSSHTSAVFPWQANHRLTYQQLSERSATVAKSLLALGVRHGDRVGILAGNRYEFLETFYGSARIGCPFVVLNNTYTPRELLAALKTSGERAHLPIRHPTLILFLTGPDRMYGSYHCCPDRSEGSNATSVRGPCRRRQPQPPKTCHPALRLF